MSVFSEEDRLKSVEVGQKVIVKYNDNKLSGIRCVVLDVCGFSVQVENRKRNFRQWMCVSDLYPYDNRVKQYIRDLKESKKEKYKSTNNLSSDFTDLIDSMTDSYCS